MKKILVLIDLQNDYFPGGALELSNVLSTGDNATKMLDFFRAEQWPVFHVQHLSIQKEAFFFIPGTQGAEINSCVTPIEGEIIVQKNYPNAFRETDLLDHLKATGLNELVFCGAMSHMCIDATVRAAFDLGYNCTVAQDACATLDLTFGHKQIPADHVHGSFMAALQLVYATVNTTDRLIKSFLQPVSSDS